MQVLALQLIQKGVFHLQSKALGHRPLHEIARAPGAERSRGPHSERSFNERSNLNFLRAAIHPPINPARAHATPRMPPMATCPVQHSAIPMRSDFFQNQINNSNIKDETTQNNDVIGVSRKWWPCIIRMFYMYVNNDVIGVSRKWWPCILGMYQVMPGESAQGPSLVRFSSRSDALQYLQFGVQ